MADSGELIVKVVRPLKLIGCVCGFFGVILVTLSTITCHWLEGKDFHQGLWRYCLVSDGEESCRMATGRVWIVACLALSVVALLFAVVAVFLSIAGLCLMRRSGAKARSIFCVSSTIMFLAMLSVLSAVILFPIMFINDIEKYHMEFKILHWYFSWSYGIAWGAVIFLFGSSVLLGLRKDTDTIIYREKNSLPVRNA